MSPKDVTEKEGSRIVQTESSRVEYVEPWKAGALDPSMQDWLRLPVGERGCPFDEHHYEWGTRNPRGYFLVRVCHHCQVEFRQEADLSLVSQIVDALLGTPRRFVVGPGKRSLDG